MSNPQLQTVEIRTSNLGRALFATSRFDAGDVILSERPLVTVPGNDIPPGWVAMNGCWRLVEALIRERAKLVEFNSWQLHLGSTVPIDELSLMDERSLHKRYRIPRNVLRSLYRRMVAYNIGYRDELDETYSIYHLLSLMNHACRPKARLVQKPIGAAGIMVSLVAIGPLQRGEEITWCYMGDDDTFLQSTYEKRQRALLDRFGFSCACALCKEEASTS